MRARAAWFVASAAAFGGACNLIADIEEATLRVPDDATTDGAPAESSTDVIDVFVEDAVDGSEAGTPCTHGPYGAESIWFGDPVHEPAFEAVLGDPTVDQPGIGGGRVSPDGLRFNQGRGLVACSHGCSCGGCYWNYEYRRASRDIDWGTCSPKGTDCVLVQYMQSFWSGEPHTFLGNRGLIACHGAALKCAYYTRTTTVDSFPFGYNCGPDILCYSQVAPFDGPAGDYLLTPTPDGRYIAFVSNRASPTDDTPPDGAAFDPNADLWTAEALAFDGGNADPAKSYGNLMHHAAASSPSAVDLPQWLSDDARTLFFTTLDGGTIAVFVTQRASASDAFGNATPVDVLSDPSANLDSFSMPSIAAMNALGHRGTGYFRRVSGGTPQYFAVPVCVGSENP